MNVCLEHLILKDREGSNINTINVFLTILNRRSIPRLVLSKIEIETEAVAVAENEAKTD